MQGKTEIKSTARRFLANHRVTAEAVARTAGLFTKPIREKNVAMFHAGRCGSTVVGMLLNQHPRVRWAGEIFASLKRKYGRDSWIWEEPLRMIRLRNNIHSCRVFGIEIKMKHLEDVNMEMEELSKSLHRMEYTEYIMLKRKNYLKREVSRIVGNKMSKWNYKKDVNTPSVKVPIVGSSGKTIQERFRDIDTFYKKVGNFFGKSSLLKISYQDDIKEDPKKALEKIYRKMDIKRVNTEVNTKKMNKKPLKERILNFEEVRDALGGTRYEWMIRGARG